MKDRILLCIFLFYLFSGSAFASTSCPSGPTGESSLTTALADPAPSACGAITGPDAVTTNSAAQYAFEGQGPVTWCVTGAGVSINSNGLVTIDNTACGSFIVSATDSCGETSKDVRVTNAGGWVLIKSCANSGSCPSTCWAASATCVYSEQYLYATVYCQHPTSCSGANCQAPLACPNYGGSWCPGEPNPPKEANYLLCLVWSSWKYEWRCPGGSEVKTVCVGGCDRTLQYVSGNGQVGDICETLKEPFGVRIPNACDDVSVNWQVTGSPQGGGGNISQSLTIKEGADMLSSAYLRLGSLPGDYLTEASCPECSDGSPQVFTAKAKCPPVPEYRQYDYPDEAYDTWCKYDDPKTKETTTVNKTCGYDDKDNLKEGYAQYKIKAKGCALTSMAMVAKRYYNSNPTPDIWNAFMTASGGYDKGDVNWHALTNTDLQLETALYKKSETPLSNSIMDTYLAKCMPVIVKVINPNTGSWHWIVVTQKLGGGDYLIQDPGYSGRLLLSAYGNKIYAIQVYGNKIGGCQ